MYVMTNALNGQPVYQPNDDSILSLMGVQPCVSCSACKVSDECKPLLLKFHKCDKCGTTSISEVYPVPYIPWSKDVPWICVECDDKLSALLDRLPAGVPEEGFQHDTCELLYAKIIIDAFFSK